MLTKLAKLVSRDAYGNAIFVHLKAPARYVSCKYNTFIIIIYRAHARNVSRLYIRVSYPAWAF